MSPTQRITTFLWFDANAEEAVNFYVSVFRNSKILSIMRCGDAGPGPKGSDLAYGELRHAEGDRRAVGAAHLGRRRGEHVRLVEGPVRAVVAGHAAPAA